MSEIYTVEQENLHITEVKKTLRDVMCQLGYWKGFENSSYTVYALLELAAEVAMDSPGLFIEASHEVDDVLSENPERFLKY